MDHLSKTMGDEKKREAEMTQKLEYLEKRLKSQRLNIEELMKVPSVAE
jgi:hypothetical protein